MARIAESSLEEIRARTDVVELVREYIPNLKQAGRSFKACCPFHQEKTPSFMVNPDKQIFHCFGCQAGGDVFSFVMRIEGLSFPESVEKLGLRAGVRIAQPDVAMSAEEKERARLRAALEFARDYYHDRLMKAADAAPARSYLAKRGVNREAVERFKLGFAPRAGSFLADAKAKGFGPELLAKVGLAADRQGRWRDYFWDRVLYPITNPKGETVGFGARTLGDAEPKYLNSPDTPLFSKGRVLYGLFEGLARLRKERRALVLEGYMDVIALHQFGLTHACAPLGTALTEDHAALIKRYADSVTILFDPDTAGAAASLRSAELLLERGLGVAIATVPGDLDPDELLHAQGVPALEKCLAAAVDLPAFRTELALKGRANLSPEDKSRIAAAILETVRKSGDEVLKREWLRRLAERLKLDEESLHLQLRKLEAGPAAQTARPRRLVAAPAKPAGRIPAREEEILLCLLRKPALALDESLLSESDLGHERSKAILAGMRKVGGDGGDWTTRLLEALSPEDAAVARGLLIDERAVKDPGAVVAALVNDSRNRKRLGEIEPLVLKGGVEPELYEEYKRLRAEIQGSRKGD